ncbi:hypothetical protein ECEC1848_4861, partial [Escherichia coli EC1848]
MASAPG